MANKTYLELTFNGLKFRRFNVTHEPESKIYKFIENLPKGVISELVITQRELKTGKINSFNFKQ